MRTLDINKFSNTYQIKRLDAKDIEDIYALCIKNTQYYAYCEKEPSKELIQQDMMITPPNIALNQKYYVGFYDQQKLMAIMDLIDGYPSSEYGFIGFFMMNKDMQGKEIGSQMIHDVCSYCKESGMEKIRLGIDKENPQSNYFWKKNGFEVIYEVVQEDGVILVAEKVL